MLLEVVENLDRTPLVVSLSFNVLNDQEYKIELTFMELKWTSEGINLSF